MSYIEPEEILYTRIVTTTISNALRLDKMQEKDNLKQKPNLLNRY